MALENPVRCRRRPLAALIAAALSQGEACALEFKASGRLAVGAVVRTEARDPALVSAVNAAALGITGTAAAGQNIDDGNMNYARHDVLSRAARGYLDLTASSGSASALLRVKAWHDDALLHDPRPWGNNPNRYAAGVPLSDAGAGRLSRFSGVALGDAYVQDSARLGAWTLFGRLGQHSLNWGARANTGSGISAIGPLDFSALRRASPIPQEFRIPVPMLFARLSREGSGLSLEGYWQTSFKPSALDVCGTFWSITDYLAEGCDRALSGPPATDRQRVASGNFLKRIDSPYSLDGPQYGLALVWKSARPGTEIGLYHARYINRVATPGLRKSSRVGPAMIAGDPDGRNLAYFSGYVGGIRMFGLSVAHQQGKTSWYGELTYRPNAPVQLPPGDVLSALLSPTASSPVRADIDALAPGAYFHAYDRVKTVQLQATVQRDFGLVGTVGLSAGLDVVFKHGMEMPDPSVRRYGRADIYGGGAYRGVCNASGPNAALQCSLDGYVTPNSWGYRARVEARFGEVLPRLHMTGALALTDEVRGWSYDFQLNEGRRTANLGLRFEYRERYLAEIGYAPVWGGRYNNGADRDQLSIMAGVKF